MDLESLGLISSVDIQLFLRVSNSDYNRKYLMVQWVRQIYVQGSYAW